MLESQKFADVKLMIDGIDFMAHKAILSSRSPVFSAMFEHPMKESEENCVEIKDMNKKVAIELLHFIYTGKVPNLRTVAKDLLAAADRYQLPQLVEICEEHLMSNLTTESAPEVLVMAHLHKANRLKGIVIEYIISNRKEIMKLDGWKLITQHPDLLEDLFKELSSQFDKNLSFGVYCP